MTSIALATEDVLSEAVGEKLIAETDPPLQNVLPLRREGFGYLKSRMGNFCKMARNQPVLMLTDLDQAVCASELIRLWTVNNPPPPTLLLRVAVREVESWLLADHDAIRTLLARPQQPLPPDPDALADPKRELIRLAAKGPRWLREAVVPPPGAVASQGLGYNKVLVGFVQRDWRPERAADRSDSLRRTRRRLQDFSTFLQCRPGHAAP